MANFYDLVCKKCEEYILYPVSERWKYKRLAEEDQYICNDCKKKEKV